MREARKAATPRDTVIVQGVDGQFQRSFSPRNGRDEGQRGRRRRGREEVRRRKRLGVKKDSNVTKLLKGKRRLL